MTARITLAVAAIVALGAHPTDAQVADSFAELSSTLKPGSTVFVLTVAGAYAPAIKGRVEKISGSILRLRVDGQDQDLDDREVVKIWERHRKAGKGAAVGLAVGAGIGMLGTNFFGLTRACGHGDHEACNWAPLDYAITAGLAGWGAGIGAVIGAFHVRERTLFSALPSATPRMTIAPLIAPTKKGVILVLDGFR
jgi:hypothetical protein